MRPFLFGNYLPRVLPLFPASFGSFGPAIAIVETDNVMKVKIIKSAEVFFSDDVDEAFFDRACVDGLCEVNANSVYMRVSCWGLVETHRAGNGPRIIDSVEVLNSILGNDIMRIFFGRVSL